MNAESSDWKRFIPHSEQFNSIYADLDSFLSQTVKDNSVYINPPQADRHFNIFESLTADIKQTEVESQLGELIRRYGVTLGHTEEILESISTSLRTLDTIENQYDEVSLVTKTLHDECQEYIGDEKSLTRVLGELQEPLSYFRDVNVITNKIGASSIYTNESSSEKNMEMEYDLYADDLSKIISRIYECIQFFRSHPSYKDSEGYTMKYIALLNRVYDMIRNKFSSLLKSYRSQIEEKSAKNELLTPSSPLYYYMTAVARGNSLLLSHILQIHAGATGELQGESCFDLYCQTRESLLEDLFAAEVKALLETEGESLEARVRSAILLMIEVCEMESDNYMSFFCSDGDSKSLVATVRANPAFTGSVSTLLETLALSAYESIRPLLLDTVQLDTLCDVVHMIKMEVIAGDVVKRNSFTAVVIPLVIKLEEDIRERIIYIAHAYIDSTIYNYNPTKEDMDYPDKLYRYYAQRRNKDYNMYATWYTPVQKVLRVLSLLYTCVDYTIMSDITVEAVTAVLHAIDRATSMLASKQTVVDGELFRIKTLLILREQISPFDLHTPGTYLPFSDTSIHDNALYRLFRRAIPTIMFINQDGLKLIEEALKQSTNKLIEAFCRDVCGTVIGLVQQYEQFMSQATSTEERFPLEEDQVVNLLSGFHDGVDRLEDGVGKIALYIDSPATQGILFSPVRRMLLNNTSHLKEILVHLKPNNFPRYLNQLSELESQINSIDATKYNHNPKSMQCDITPEEDIRENEKDVKYVIENSEVSENSIEETLNTPNQEKDDDTEK